MRGIRDSGFGIRSLRIFAIANIRNVRTHTPLHREPRTPNPQPRSRSEQAGAAVIAALLVVALVAVVTTTLLSRQSQALTRVQATLTRAQATQYATTGLQWARGILADDAKRGSVDHLGEAWARPLTALPVDDALVSGRIRDAQGLFNLNNLVRDNQLSVPDLQLFRRLLGQLGLDAELAYAVADWIDANSDVNTASGAEDAFYLAQKVPRRAANRPLMTVEELIHVRGFTADAVRRLKPHVTALPAITRINLNTADETVLAAVIPELDVAERQALMKARESRPFQELTDIRARHPKVPPTVANNDLAVKSDFFLVEVAIAAGPRDHPVEMTVAALLKRDGAQWPAIIRSHPL